MTPVTVKHSRRRSEDDERTMLEALHQKYGVFKASGSHTKFPRFSCNHQSRIDRDKFQAWIQGHIATFGKAQNKELFVAVTPKDPQLRFLGTPWAYPELSFQSWRSYE